MVKKLLALILAVCFIASVLISCADTVKDDEGEKNETAESSSVSGENETTDSWSHDAIEDTNYNGREFKIISITQVDIGPDKEDGTSKSDALEAAIWERNRYVEDRFNISIVGYCESDDYMKVSEKIKTMAKSGTSEGEMEYNVAFSHMVDSTSLATGGYLYNLNKLEQIDKTAAWWDKDVKKGFQVNGVLYMLAGDILPHTMLLTACMAFNKTLIDNDSTGTLVYPYEAARNREWTLDMLATMTKDYTTDKNNNGTYDSEEDRKTETYGLTSWHLDSPFNFFYGSGCTMIVNNGEDTPEYIVDETKLQSIYDKVYEVFITNNSLYIQDINTYRDAFKIFSEGRSLFVSCSLSTMHGESSEFKQMTDDFGVVPQPLYEKGGEYLGFVNGAAAMLTVPNVIVDDSADAKFTGDIIEALANASYNMVTYTLYEVTAKAKNVNDSDSADMVDIIVRNRVFDFGYAHFFSSNLPCATLFRDALDAKTVSLASLIKKGSKSTTNQLKKLVQKYEKNGQ